MHLRNDKLVFILVLQHVNSIVWRLVRKTIIAIRLYLLRTNAHIHSYIDTYI